MGVTAGATMASVRPKPSVRLRLSPTMAMEVMEATMADMEAMVVTVLDTAGATTASVRLRLSPTMATEDTEDMEATGATVATMVATMASVRPRLTPTMAMEVMEATEVTVMATASNMFPNSSNEYYFAQP